MTQFETWSVVLGSATVISNLTLFLVFYLQLKELRQQVHDSRKSTERDHNRRRAQATVEFYEATLAQRFATSSQLPRDRDKDGIAEVIRGAVSGDLNLAHGITEHLNLWELVATGVGMDIFDFETMYRIAGGRVIAMADNYQDWINLRREVLNTETLYIEIEQLASRLRIRQNEIT